METIRCIIIDDEPPARELIKIYLKDHPDVTILTECSDGFQAIKEIQEQKPDLIFLDIQMPRLTGFEMLELLENPPVIIFSTAYQEYAIKAFELSAVDYLLKPFSRERFQQSLDKAREKIKLKSLSSGKIQELINTVPSEKLERIVVKTGTKVKIIPVESILYLEAQDDYVMIYTPEGKFLKQQTMKYFEEALEETAFLRTHRSYIVRIDQIAQIEPYEKDSHQVALKNQTRLPVSKSGYAKLKKVLGL